MRRKPATARLPDGDFRRFHQQANLLARHLINEAYFAMDDIAEAAQKGDQAAAKEAWTRGKDYLNSYLKIVNIPISAKVGDKFPQISAFDAPPPAPPAPPPAPEAAPEAAAPEAVPAAPAA